MAQVNHLPSFTCDSPLDEDIKRPVPASSKGLYEHRNFLI